MNRETSLYLDLVRFSASMVVMLGHLSGKRFTNGLLWQLGNIMDDAVVVFFVLSGFVIAYVADRKERGVENYVIARAARIYSVALPALVLTFILDAIGGAIAPDFYSADWGYHDGNLAGKFLACVFFINQLWYSPVVPGSMLPYWSLGFEVWYYIFFAIIFLIRSKWRLVFFLIACAISGPRIVAFFPIWMFGYFAYVHGVRRQPGRSVGLLLLALSVLGFAFYYFVLKIWLSSHPLVSETLGLTNFANRYIVGALFALHLMGFMWAAKTFSFLLTPWQSAIRWLAGATFTIYLLHLPVAQFLTTVMPWAPSDWRTKLIVLGGTLMLTFIVAQFTERKKDTWRQLITAMYSWLKSRVRPSVMEVQLHE